MWLRKGDNLVLVPEHMPETIQRCLGDGWVEAPDPRVTPTLEPDADAQPLPEPQPPRSPLPPLDVPLDLPLRRAQRGRR